VCDHRDYQDYSSVQFIYREQTIDINIHDYSKWNVYNDNLLWYHIDLDEFDAEEYIIISPMDHDQVRLHVSDDQNLNVISDDKFIDSGLYLHNFFLVDSDYFLYVYY